MRSRTLGAVCATCAVAVPVSSEAQAQTLAPSAPGQDIVAGTPPASITDARMPALIERQIRLQRAHHRLHGERLSNSERADARVALARLTPNELRSRTQKLRGHVRTLRRKVERERHGGAPDVPIPAALKSIAQCESHSNPRAVSSDGTYRGKYQFDFGTWASVGGKGDPAAASETEQDRRAAMLYKRSGATPWPICGS
jgi:hypothetical protein